MPRSIIALLLVASACSRPAEPAWARPGAARAGEPTITGDPAAIPRLATPPVLDGKLDDPVWAGAATLGPFVDVGDGRDGSGRPVAAFARVGWDDTHLYLGVIVQDRAPASPFGRDDDDPHIWSRSSAVEIMLQPGDPGDNRDYYEIQVDVAGAVFDSHWDDYNTPIRGSGDAKVFGHQDWSSHIERAVSIEEGGFYCLELALPWAALAPARVVTPPRPGDVWRLEMYSFRDGQRQSLGWTPIRGQGNFHRASRFGRVRFQ